MVSKMPPHKQVKKNLEFDSPWKEIIELYFKSFVEFFFPNIYTHINWDKNYEFLDKELQKVVREAVTQSRRVDKLVKVWLTNGETTLLYIHIEIQGQVETDFAQRMFIYHYRLYDRYGAQIMSLAILGDSKTTWRPQHYKYEQFGCHLAFTFPIVKLLDYKSQWAQLEKETNPFALVVRVHLKGLETQRKPDERYQWKIQLYKALYEAKYSKKEILALFRFLDWVMILPDSLEQAFTQFTHDYEEAKQMRYVTSVERFGIQKGMQQGMQQGIQKGIQKGVLLQSQEAIIEVLQVRFSTVPVQLIQQIRQIQHTESLSNLLKVAVIEPLDVFEKQLHQLLQ